MKKLLYFLTLLLFAGISSAQTTIDDEADKCGYISNYLKSTESTFGNKWGYSYDSLLNDVTRWGNNEYIEIQSIGQSTQGREMYELTITDLTIPNENKHRIYIHARTHAGEVQSFWVTDEIINIVGSNTELGELLRSHFIFNIVPMYNPDGVELEYDRENANGIDIESNWNASVVETEVNNLRSRFSELMNSDNPIEIALNMHSAYECNRYFVYHHANGTSSTYAEMEQDFIESIRNYYSIGIESYSHFVSWTTSTPDRYPESWWWLNHGEDVIALTYEDMNCSSAGHYDSTAFAITKGILYYYDLYEAPIFTGTPHNSKENLIAFPTIFDNTITIKSTEQIDAIELVNSFGQKVKFIQNLKTDVITLPTQNLQSGIYFCKISLKGHIDVVQVMKL